MKKIQLTTETLLDLREDAVFKAVFTKDTSASRGALRSLISATIRQELDILTVIANEPPVNTKDDRQIRYDIACKFNNGEKADIEMTLYPGKFEVARMEYYLGRLHCLQELKGVPDYATIKQSYQISFLGENIFKDAFLLHAFEYYDQEHSVALHGRTRLVVVELKKVGKLAKKPLEQLDVQEKWALFFQSVSDPGKLELVNRLLEEEEGIAMAGQTMLEVTPEEREYFLQMSRDKYQFDVWSRKRELWEKDQEIAEKNKKIAEKDRKMAEKDKKMAEKDKKIAEKDRKIAEKDKKIAELQRLLNEKA
jgi:hypothetical protein